MVLVFFKYNSDICNGILLVIRDMIMDNPNYNLDEERLIHELLRASRIGKRILELSDFSYKEEEGRSFLDTLRSMTSVPVIVPVTFWSTIYSTSILKSSIKINRSFFNTLKKDESQQLTDLVFFAFCYSFTFLGNVICTLCRRKEHLFEKALFSDKNVLQVIYSLLDSFYDPYSFPKTTPSLEVIFKGFIHWKKHLAQVGMSDYCASFFLMYAENILDLDYTTYHRIRDTINFNDYERFCELVYSKWSGKEIKVLSKEQRLLYILLGFGEISYTLNFQPEDDPIQKLYSRNPFAFAPENFFVMTVLMQYFYENAFVKTLNPKEVYSINFYWKSGCLEKFAGLYSKWVNKEIKQLKPDTETKKQTKKEHLAHLKVPCGRRTLEKFINGLINGHKDDTLGNFTPLVSSNKGEDNESIKKKLICLFTGEGINDESIKWPYDLKWNDYRNSLKLIIYLFHYEDVFVPKDAIDENDPEGINEKIRTVFTGKNVWAIVGTALGYGENTLRNKVQIPQDNNISLMKKLAQFWFECNKLVD